MITIISRWRRAATLTGRTSLVWDGWCMCVFMWFRSIATEAILTARFAYSLTQHFLNRRTIEIIWNWRNDWSGTMRYIIHSQIQCHKQWWKSVRSSGRRSFRNSEALACLCDRQRRRKKSVLNQIEIRSYFLLTTFFVIAFYNLCKILTWSHVSFPTFLVFWNYIFFRQVWCGRFDVFCNSWMPIKYQPRPNIS